jgi:hypothetical protein
MRDDAYCACCCQEEETINHLLVGCSYAREVWFKVLRSCGWQGLMPGYGDCFVPWWLRSRRRVVKRRRVAFDSLAVLTAFSLLLERNAHACSSLLLQWLYHLSLESGPGVIFGVKPTWREVASRPWLGVPSGWGCPRCIATSSSSLIPYVSGTHLEKSSKRSLEK